LLSCRRREKNRGILRQYRRNLQMNDPNIQCVTRLVRGFLQGLSSNLGCCFVIVYLAVSLSTSGNKMDLVSQMRRALSLEVKLEELSRERHMLKPMPLTIQDNVTHRPTAWQRLGKHARNTHAANNTGEVFSMWSAPCPILDNGPIDLRSDSRRGVYQVVRPETVC
jgi:hypothetical protein